MGEIIDYIIGMEHFFPLMRTIIAIIILFIIHKFIHITVRNRLLKKARTKKQKSNVEIFLKVINFAFAFVLIIFVTATFSGSLTGLGIGVGLLSAALGWALQTPITGFAAWIMVIIKRPFDIGDRIIIGSKKGDVFDITPTHIYLNEIGGIIEDAEDYSGRIIMIPNSVLFSESIINYTMQDDFILGQVVLSIPYECNLEKAIKIALDATNKFTKEYQKITGKKPYTRVVFMASSVDIKARYHVPATKIQSIATLITQEIFEKVSKEKDVEVAYPHREVIYRKK